MANELHRYGEDALPAAALASLGRCAAAAWLIDPRRALVLAANGAGHRRLGLDRAPARAVLDAASPAVAKLRAFGGGKARKPQTHSVSLGFWIDAGVTTLAAAVTALDEGLLLVAATDAEPAEPSPPPRKPEPAVAAALESPPSPTVLRELAHEIKTPLSAIASAADLMRQESLGPIGDRRYVGYAEEIVAAAMHALAVVDRLLGPSRAARDPAGQQIPTISLAVPAGHLAREVEGFVRRQAEAAAVKFEVDIEDPPFGLAADAVSVREILVNLLVNAVKATPAGGLVKLSLRTTRRGEIEFEVRDTGIGLTKEQWAGEPSSASAGGHGIGLPLARRLAEEIGARLSYVVAKPRVGVVAKPHAGGVAKPRGTLVRLRFPPVVVSSRKR